MAVSIHNALASGINIKLTCDKVVWFLELAPVVIHQALKSSEMHDIH
jgi:hypothetical protein